MIFVLRETMEIPKEQVSGDIAEGNKEKKPVIEDRISFRTEIPCASDSKAFIVQAF